jgi:lipoprotein-releasing system permease protein
VILGTRLAFRFGLKPGDSITLLSPNGNATAFGTVPRIKSYRVAGIFDVGMFEYDNNYILMPLSSAQLFFKTGEGVSSLEVFASDPDHLETQARAIRAIVGPTASILDWQHSNQSLDGPSRRENSCCPLTPADHAVAARRHLRRDHVGEGQGPRI